MEEDLPRVPATVSVLLLLECMLTRYVDEWMCGHCMCECKSIRRVGRRDGMVGKKEGKAIRRGRGKTQGMRR